MKSSLSLPRRLRTGAVVVAALAATGWAMKPIEQPAWEAVSRNQPALQLDSLSANFGEGIVVGLLGGFRGIAADLCWLRAYSDWEDNNYSDFPVGLQLTVDFDPRPIGFWTTGALQLAFDVPHWCTDANGTYYDRIKDPKGRAAIDRVWSGAANKFLEQGLTYHPNNFEIYVQIAEINGQNYNRIKDTNELRLKDLAMAAKYYRKAAEAPGAKAFAARLYARELIEMAHQTKDPSKYQEAYDWLRRIYPTLPKVPVLPEGLAIAPDAPAQHLQIEANNAQDVLELIREVEQEMKIPPAQAFQP